MKKEVIRFVRCALVKMLFFGAVYPLHAQVSNPSSWESFVGSNANTLVSDTFRLQTFGISEWDNWEYTLTGNSSLVQEKHTIKIPIGSRITFQPFSLSHYTNVYIMVHIAGLNLKPGESLLFNVYRNNADETIKANTPEKGKDFMSYKDLIIGSNPSAFSITTSPGDNTSNGYYMTDSLCAYGNIPSYSLFTGNGNWNDTTLWSHLPPLRHRNALIKGEASITTDTYCQDIAIHSGTLKIHSGNRLILQNLDLHENQAFLYSEGTIHLSDRITFHKTFEESGQWYFISFPFDVYPTDIAPGFIQKDDTPNDGGDYFYVQSYNGDKRASANQSAGNWEVLPVRTANTPLFEKNKGYLIALDEKATSRTLSFSSRPGDLPEEFANTGTITIPLGTDMTSDNQENYGWYLCGNPFPAPLSLTRIEKNEALDGNIYVYDGNGYKTYSLNSHYAVPPFAAFFVKASSPTELRISSNSIPTKATNIIPTNIPLSKSRTEPHPARQSTGIKDPDAERVRFYIKDGQLHLHNIPEAGYIRIVNMLGQCLLQKKIGQGSQEIPVPNASGVHILQIQTGRNQKCYKVTLP